VLLEQRDGRAAQYSRRELHDAIRVGVFDTGTADLSYLLADAINKTVKIGLGIAPSTWRPWVRTSQAPDYKTLRRISYGRTSNPEEVVENGEYKIVQLSDQQETFAVTKYGKILSLTREAIINDDLGELASIPAVSTQSAASKLSDLAYAALVTQTMSDGQVLCHSSHINVASATGISAAGLSDIIILMRKQTNSSGDYINVAPRYLIVPPEIESKPLALIDSTSLSLGAPGSTSQVMALEGASLFRDLALIVEPRLFDSSTTTYYSTSTPPVELATIEGGDGVSIESENGFTVDGVQYKVRLEADAAPIEYRGAAKNPGA
jgi:hypothetical protein